MKTMNLEISTQVRVKSNTPKQSTMNTPPYSIIEGDARKRSLIKKESVDLVVTSPPYNVGMAYSGDGKDDLLNYEDYLKFSRKWISNAYHWTKNTGRFCLNVGLDKNKDGKRPVCSDLTRIAMDAGWNYHATIIWNEGNISRRTAWGSWMSASAPHVIAPVEVIIVMHKGEWKRDKRGESDITGEEFKNWVLGVWNFNGESAKRIGHEAPFPRELPKRCIKLFSYEEDTILDPFLGSGTTIIEAATNNRKSIGIEVEPKYCELAETRIQNVLKGEEIKITTQMELIKEFFEMWPCEEREQSEVTNWCQQEWNDRTGKNFHDVQRATRKLVQEGWLQRVRKGVFVYVPD